MHKCTTAFPTKLLLRLPNLSAINRLRSVVEFRKVFFYNQYNGRKQTQKQPEKQSPADILFQKLFSIKKSAKIHQKLLKTPKSAQNPKICGKPQKLPKIAKIHDFSQILWGTHKSPIPARIPTPARDTPLRRGSLDP